MSKKTKLEHLSDNEWLGDATTHFMKSGDTLRSSANDSLSKLADIIPRRTPFGIKVEYDITYDIPKLITGYKYTDFLTKAVYLAPNSYQIAKDNITEIASLGPTAEGEKVISQLRASITDKYILDNDDDDYEAENLIVLPGTNLLIKEAVNLEQIDLLVQEGAKVKFHPITSLVWQTMLTKRWGKKNVIPADAPLYPVLRACDKVYFPMSSETGFSAVLLGKKIGNISAPKQSNSNFEFIYRGLDAASGGSLLQKMTALFSHQESGILTVFHRDPRYRLLSYFEHMHAKYPHEDK